MSARAVATRPASIAWPIFALVIGAVLAATAILFFVTFSGPPPMEPPRPLPMIAAALKGEAQASPRRRFGPPPRYRPLKTFTQAAPPAPRSREEADPATAARIAALLGAPRQDVVALTEPGPRGMGDELFGRYTVAWRTASGWRVVRSRPMAFSGWHLRTLLAMLLATGALSLPAWAIARAITRPLRDLADAAGRAQAGAARPAFPTGGPAEVRATTAAVSAMHDRLAGHAEGRTAMLGAIAHDLGTPLSRLAFWIEQLPDPARERAAADIDEMRAMIADTLRFARDDADMREAVRVDVASLLDSLVEDMAVAGAPVTLTPGPRAVVRGDPVALRRAVTNLAENAIRYGDHAAVSWDAGGDRVAVHVADTGTGIDPAQAERLFEPFVRGERSRNRATGGTGLGLAIVRSIAARHGGTATLANRADGPGAVATLTLPLEGMGSRRGAETAAA